MNVAAKIEQRINEYRERVLARRNAIIASIAAENNGKEPTEDRNGRFHAPYNGYTLPDDFRDGGAIYGAGEFLPILRDEEDELFTFRESSASCRVMYNGRVKATLEAVEEAIAVVDSSDINHALSISKGAVWKDTDGVEICYAYIKCTVRTLFDDIKSFLQKPVTVVEKQPEIYIEGRKTVTATVIKTYHKQYDRFIQTKMLCKTEEGHLINVSVPSSVWGVERDNIVEFTATFTKGTDGWSIGKRPSKAKYISKGEINS